MKKTALLATLAFVWAGPGLASGWVDGEVRAAAEGPEWKTPTAVASMPKPSASNPMPMGVQSRPTGTKTSDLAAEVADWEASKERHGPVVALEDRKWKMRPTHERYVEIGHPVEKDLPKHLVHDLHEGEYHRHGAAAHGYGEYHAGYGSHGMVRVHSYSYEETGGSVGYDAPEWDHHGHGHGHGHYHPPMPAHGHAGHSPKAGETPHHVLEIDVDLRDNCGSICWYEITHRP